jgi:hypothetical protein
VDQSREGGLLAWQFRIYANGHRDRRNLAVHAVTVPLFVAGSCGAGLAPFIGPWLLFLAVPAVALPLVLQGRGHHLESTRPEPFRGPGDFVARIFVEQWVTFPRYVMSGGFSRAWRGNGASAERPRPG